MAKRDPSGNHKFLEFMLNYLYTSTIQAGNLGIGNKERALELQKLALENPVSYLTHQYSEPYVNAIKKNVEIFAEKSQIGDLYRYKNIYDYIKNGRKGIWQTDFIVDSIAAENHLSGAQRKKLEKQGKKIYEDDKWLVIIPLTHKSSCYYGAGTKWCTTQKDSSTYFDDYKRRGELYYIIDKKHKKGDPLQKMALLVTPTAATLYNAPDDQIPVDKLRIPDKALMEIISDGLGKDYAMGKFIREVTEDGNALGIKKMLWDRYKDNPNLLVGALGMHQIGEIMGHAKAQKWLRQKAKKGDLSLEYLEDNFESWASAFPIDALIITDATGEYLAPLIMAMGLFELRGDKTYPKKDLQRLERKFLDGLALKDITFEEGDKVVLHMTMKEAADLFESSSTAESYMGEDWPDIGYHSDWNPGLDEMWDLLDDDSIQDLREYYRDEYKEEFPETDFMKMESEDLLEFTEDNAPSVEDELGSSYRIAYDDAVVQQSVDGHLKLLSDLFDAPEKQHWYNNKDSKFHFDITHMFWETLSSYAHDNVGHEDEFPDYYFASMLAAVLQETNELLDMDFENMYIDDDDIENAGFNDVFRDRIGWV